MVVHPGVDTTRVEKPSSLLKWTLMQGASRVPWRKWGWSGNHRLRFKQAPIREHRDDYNEMNDVPGFTKASQYMIREAFINFRKTGWLMVLKNHGWILSETAIRVYFIVRGYVYLMRKIFQVRTPGTAE
ncbi:MAG: hypothetical protein ACOC7U_04960 [Spirochaetota bacterium]